MRAGLASSFLCLLLISSCGGDSNSTSPLLSFIVVTPSHPNVPAGVTVQFTATGKYSDGSSRDLTAQAGWSSLDTSVSTISTGGLATAVSSGTTTIAATSGNISGSTPLTVNSSTLSSISIAPADPRISSEVTGQSAGSAPYSGGANRNIGPSVNRANLRLAVGITRPLAARGLFSDGTSYDLTSQVAWSSSNPSVAMVDNGMATAVSQGTAIITAASGVLAGSTVLTVSAATLSSIAVTPPQLVLPVGVTRQLAATGTYSDGSSYDITARVAWSSSDPFVAPVDGSGLATGQAAGVATAAAQLGSISGSTTVTVTTALLSSLSITPADSILPVGVTELFTATGTYSDGSSYNISGQVTWGSSDPSVVTIDSGGLGTTTGAGTATITAVSGSTAGSTILVVTPR